MGKCAVESVHDMLATLRSSHADDGYLIPDDPQFSESFKASSATENCHMVPNWDKPSRRACLDGNYVRRKLPLQPHEYCVWDTELPGFGLRVRPTGRHYWFVRLRHSGKHRRASLGCSEDMDAVLARAQARRLLAEVALAFGDTRVADVARADISHWRDGFVGANESKFNRALPVFAALLKYAEQLHLGRKGSNPCRGMARYKRPAAERYLSPLEYRRLGAALRDEEKRQPAEVAIIRLLLYTGARISEIRDLRWEWVRPLHLALPDSKTGPKTIWLNSQALAILDAVPRRDGCVFVFPNTKGSAPLKPDL